MMNKFIVIYLFARWLLKLNCVFPFDCAALFNNIKCLPKGGMGWSSVYDKGISCPYPSGLFPWVFGSRCGPVHEIVML